jgi:hypothetical protein
MSDPRYPVGTFQGPTEPLAAEARAKLIDEIAALPGRLRSALGGLSETQLDTPYREGGWTVRQVAHHLPDSHLNGYTRFRLALTEDTPTIKPYDEAGWAELSDAKTAPAELSLRLLEAVHARWVLLLRSVREEQWLRAYHHPEMKATAPLYKNLALYAWHGRHHLAHVTSLRERLGWH